eukprot:TRINITY_DN8573_c0_g1_i3.p1 TRINITY_DN8573_c0_g1~~TRINITY_DN8573_c0_g1_i3.p1  ORF type:complete len:631 (-),score=147.76 TRINITY_DN8573_c0_g1_i3:106-1998(-)
MDKDKGGYQVLADIHKRERKLSFDLVFLRRLVGICRILSVRVSMGVVACMLIIILINTYVVSLTGGVIGGFYGVLVDREQSQLKATLIKAVCIIMSSALLDSSLKFTTELLAWTWRRTLCSYVQTQYFKSTVYYKINALGVGDVDNPDQRITSDIDLFCTTLAAVTFNCIGSPLTIAYYAFKTARSIAWFVPLMISGYFLIGYLAAKLVMAPIVRLVYHQEALEGNFRVGHVRVRDHAEEIAMLDGEPRELEGARDRLQALLANKMRIMRWHWGLNSTNNTFAYMGSILNYLVIILAVFFGPLVNATITSAFVAEAAFMSIMLVSGFSTFMTVGTSISDLAGYTARIAIMLEVATEAPSPSSVQHEPPSGDGAPAYVNIDAELGHLGSIVPSDIVTFENVSCFTPLGRQLFRGVSFSVRPGDGLLITGPSGCGKSTLLRALSGIWPFFTGTISKPVERSPAAGPSPPHTHREVFYLSQRSYLVQGSLMDQIVYPRSLRTHPLSSSLLHELLASVQLTHLLDVEAGASGLTNWADVLSPGEQQRIAFARLFYHRPQYAVLDEATSSLSEVVEGLMYRRCQELNITTLSVGHRSSLLAYHPRVLEFTPPQTSAEDGLVPGEAQTMTWTIHAT